MQNKKANILSQVHTQLDVAPWKVNNSKPRFERTSPEKMSLVYVYSSLLIIGRNSMTILHTQYDICVADLGPAGIRD